MWTEREKDIPAEFPDMPEEYPDEESGEENAPLALVDLISTKLALKIVAAVVMLGLLLAIFSSR